MGASERLGPVLVGALIGGAMGFGLAYLLRPAGASPGEAASGTRARFESSPPAGADVPQTALLPPDRSSARERPSEPEPEPEPDVSGETERESAGADELIPARLAAYAEREMSRAWSEARTMAIPPGVLGLGMAEWRATVLESPAAIGARLARDQTELEAARAVGTAFELFERLEMGAGPMPDLVADAEAFESLFQPETPATAIDATQIDWSGGGRVPDGSTLRFPAGVFELRTLASYWTEFPRDVTLQGAGRDATLLVGEITARDAIRNLKLSDMTFYNPRGGLTDLRRAGAVLSLENLRLVGWDTGAGGSSAIDTKALAFLAKNCLFAGGYGKKPGHSNLFDVRTDALLARFDNCTLERIDLDLTRIRAGATVVFDRCRLIDLYRDPRTQSLPPGVELDGCTITLAEGHQADWMTTMKRDLNELFPGWEEKLNR